ncbi:MAG: transposase [Anaerolineales bacterium]
MTFHSINDPTHLCFVTASIVGWIHIFKESEYAEILLDSLKWMQKQERIPLFAFAIMPSHLHLIIKPEHSTIGEVLQQFGSFTAHEILNRCRQNNRTEWLKIFQQKHRDLDTVTASGRIFKQRIFSQQVSSPRKWNISIKTLLPRNGNW